jgi:hypothetical protein
MRRRYQHQVIDAQQAMGFLLSQLTYIEAAVYRTRYPDIQYAQLIPIDTSAPEWTKSITHFSLDQVGQAAWFHARAKDIPLAEVERTKFEAPVSMAAIGYRYDIEELGQAMMIRGMNLPADKALAAKRGYELFVDEKALRGDTQKNWTGLFNDANVTAADAPADGTGSSSAWVDKTSAQIVRDINAALSGIWIDSETVEMADTILLPVAMLDLIATRQFSTASDITILEWVRRYNTYTTQTGQQLTIRGVRGLESAGDGGTGRMITYRRSPEVLKLHIPMPHQFLPVWQTGPLVFDVPGIFRFGGVEIRLPGAVRYTDAIMDMVT